MVSASTVADGELPAPAPPPPPLPFFPPLMKPLMKSMGTGKMIVEFFSAAMELSV